MKKTENIARHCSLAIASFHKEQIHRHLQDQDEACHRKQIKKCRRKQYLVGKLISNLANRPMEGHWTDGKKTLRWG